MLCRPAFRERTASTDKGDTMLYSITDIGSNTVKMNIFDTSLSAKDGPRPVFSESITLKLASMRENGALSKDGIDLLCDVLLKYREDSEKLGSDSFFAFATASIRNVYNTEEVKKAVFSETGISIDVLSGDEEARLSFLGMKGEYPNAERGLMVDMGGGSTELIAFAGSAPTASVSIPVGCVMLKSQFVQNGIFPTLSEQDAISGQITEMLDNNSSPTGIFSDVYLIGGTARALFRLAMASGMAHTGTEHANHRGKIGTIILRGKAFSHRSGYKENESGRHNISSEDFANIYSIYRNACCDPFASNMIRASVPERLDTVVPGMSAIECILKRYGIKTLHLVTSGVREGYLMQLLSKAPV